MVILSPFWGFTVKSGQDQYPIQIAWMLRGSAYHLWHTLLHHSRIQDKGLLHSSPVELCGYRSCSLCLDSALKLWTQSTKANHLWFPICVAQPLWKLLWHQWLLPLGSSSHLSRFLLLDESYHIGSRWSVKGGWSSSHNCVRTDECCVGLTAHLCHSFHLRDIV